MPVEGKILTPSTWPIGLTGEDAAAKLVPEDGELDEVLGELGEDEEFWLFEDDGP